MALQFQDPNDTICAISSPEGLGAVSLIRLSGSRSLEVLAKVFSKDLSIAKTHTAHFGIISDGQKPIDEVLVTVFKNPTSFTGEDLIEIGCHGSPFIQATIVKLLLSKGARLAGPGEFSLRAFMNGKMDLSQTEAIADLISSRTTTAHEVAMNQMRGGFSKEISDLRQQLMDFASLIELELDFSEEDVEFADRKQLEELIVLIKNKVDGLVSSFDYGNAIKNGVPVAIVGAPNAGKSTILNGLLNEDKAIVSEIAGTTRDVIEDTTVIEGIEFRFFDTAGIRETEDAIESKGIEKAYEKIKSARIVLLIFDLYGTNTEEVLEQIKQFGEGQIAEGQSLIAVFNKQDKIDKEAFQSLNGKGIFLSAKDTDEIHQFKKELIENLSFNKEEGATIVTNLRHYDVLTQCLLAIDKIELALQNNTPGDLMAMDIREALNLLGEVTGEISSDELLGNIFANFCIGK